MWYEFLLAGLKKFAGEIIGIILLAVFWRMFPRLWAWVSQYRAQKKDEGNASPADIQKVKEIQRQLEAERREKERIQAEVQRESERRAEVQRQLEAQRKEQERIQAEIRRKERLSQEEARRLEGALRKSEVKPKPEVKRQYPAMSDKDFAHLGISGDARKVEEAIMNGANVNAKGKYGRTALMVAV